MKFIPHRNQSTPYISRSEDGYYAIKRITTDPYASKYEALYIEAVWAKEASLGVFEHQDQAMHACVEHRGSLAVIRPPAEVFAGVR